MHVSLTHTLASSISSTCVYMAKLTNHVAMTAVTAAAMIAACPWNEDTIWL